MIYFDNAATTFPKPSSVSQAIDEAVRIYGGNPGRSGHALSMKTAEHIYQIRSRAAKMFGVEVENLVFTSNCTSALNMAIKGYPWKRGQVITSNLEHNAVSRPVYSLARRGIFHWEIAKVHAYSQTEMLSSFLKHFRKGTRAVICTHASNVTGEILPIRKLAKLCHARGAILIVDAAQTAGLLPISIRDDEVDIICAAGHKGLYGPTGTGIMAVAPHIHLKTIWEGGTGSNSKELTQPPFPPDRFEAGTINTVGICGLGAGIDFVQKQGIDAIYQHEMQLSEFVFRSLQEIKKIKLYNHHFASGTHVPVISFNIDGMTSMETGELLNRKGFALRSGLHCSPMAHRAIGSIEEGTVRFCPSIFNTMEQIKEFLLAIEEIVSFK